jgi:hypothetical protein
MGTCLSEPTLRLTERASPHALPTAHPITPTSHRIAPTALLAQAHGWQEQSASALLDALPISPQGNEKIGHPNPVWLLKVRGPRVAHGRF